MNARYLIALALLASAPALAAPTHTTGSPIALGERTELAPGIEVVPLAVIEDSRCPVTVDCMWAGRLVLAAQVHDGPNVIPVRLTLGSPYPIADGQLILTAATPEKRETAIAPQDYRFSFVFHKLRKTEVRIVE